MIDCIDELQDDIVFSCDESPVAGIAGSRAVIINYDDIDRSATTSNRSLVTNLQLKAGKTGRLLKWYKKLGNDNNTYAPNAENIDGFIHSFLCRLPNSSAENANRAHELKNGNFVIVYESKFKGVDGKDAFKVLGFQNGMTLSEFLINSKENAGSAPFTISTEEDTPEQYPYNVFLEGDDYAVTLATFESLFVEA